MNRGYVKRRKDTDLLGFCGKTRGPGKRFKIAVIKIDLASHTFPASYGNNRLDPGLFSELGDSHRLLPLRLKCVRSVGHRASVTDIETEDAEFQLVWAAFEGVAALFCRHGEGPVTIIPQCLRLPFV